MFSLGLGLRGSDFARVFRFPRVFAVGLLNQLVLLPLVAFGLVLIFKLPPILAVGMMILALCPGGVTSNMLTRIANGNAAPLHFTDRGDQSPLGGDRSLDGRPDRRLFRGG